MVGFTKSSPVSRYDREEPPCDKGRYVPAPTMSLCPLMPVMVWIFQPELARSIVLMLNEPRESVHIDPSPPTTTSLSLMATGRKPKCVAVYPPPGPSGLQRTPSVSPLLLVAVPTTQR